MRWNLDNLNKYEEGKEYFDTAILPCYRITLSKNKLEELDLVTKIHQFAYSLDEQLTGRVILFPPIVFYGENEDQLAPSLKNALETLEKEFKHILILSGEEDLEELLKDLLSKSLRSGKGTVLSAADTTEESMSSIFKLWQS